MISIVIPYYEMRNADFYISRCTNSIRSQSYQDFEIVIIGDGSATQNINKGVKQATGDIIKVLCMDDFFTDKHALKRIVDAFKGTWMVHGVNNNEQPLLTGDLHLGNNKLGGLSSIVFRKDKFIPFDESLVWLLDCDWYKKMIKEHGLPTLLNGNYVKIEEGENQSTNIISKEIKNKEVMELRKRYV